MYESLNQSCFPELGTDRFVEIAAEAGVASVELRTLGRSESTGAIAAAVRGSGLKVEAVNGLMDQALPDDPDPRPALDRLLEVAVVVGAPVIVCAGPIRMEAMPPYERIATSAAERLAALVSIAHRAGVRLALEQVGRSSTRPGAISGIRRLREALAIVDRVGDGAALALDSYNLATAGEPFDEIRNIPLSRIGIAQIADRDAATPNQTIPRGYPVPPGYPTRGLPGEGDLDLDAFVQALAAVGYDGPLSLEIFPTEPWPDPLGFARQAVTALRQLTETFPREGLPDGTSPAARRRSLE